MKNPFKLTKTIIIKVDDFREEKLEDFLFNNILKGLDGNPAIDKLEKQGIIAGITAASAYASTYGLPSCPDEVKERIAEETVIQLSKVNKHLQKQNSKKSKWYQSRHSGI